MTLDPKFIEMFAKADKLQEMWKPEVGDRTDKGIICSTKNNGLVQLLGYVNTLNKMYLTFLPSSDWMAGVWGEKTKRPLHTKDDAIFLQCISDHIHAYEIGLDEESFVDVNWPLPIIVLAFLMSDCYSKTWSETEKEWV